MKTKSLLGAAALTVLIVAAVSVRRVPQASRFCDFCVLRQDAVEWRLAGRWKLHETTTTSATPVSELLLQHQACPPHEHLWSAPRHIAEAELETADAPRVRSLGLLNEPRAVNFLRALFNCASARDVAAWREVAWQPAYASALEPALRFCRFPENGFTSSAEFYSWWNQNSYPLFNRLHAVTEAD